MKNKFLYFFMTVIFNYQLHLITIFMALNFNFS